MTFIFKQRFLLAMVLLYIPIFLGASIGDENLVSKQSKTVTFDQKSISAPSTNELHVDTSISPVTTVLKFSPIMPKSNFVSVTVPFYGQKIFYHTNAPDENGMTPLHHAAIHGDIDTAVALLEDSQTLPNQVDIYGAIPLHYAVQSGSLAIFKKLIARGTFVNRQMYDSDISILHIAATNGSVDLLQEILKVQGLNVNVQDLNKRTVLHYAVMYRNEVMVKKLLQEPLIDIYLKDATQLSASDYAEADSIKDLFSSHVIEKKS